MIPGKTILLLAAVAVAPAFAVPTVSVAPLSLYFNATSGGANPDPQTVTITADEPAFLQAYTTAYLPSSANTWLTVLPVSPSVAPGYSLPQALTIYATPGTLPAGNYNATVTLNFGSSVQQFTVFLTVTGGTGGGINPNQTITASPASLAFAFSPGGTVPAPQTIAVATNDATSFSVTAITNDGGSWLTATPASSTSPGTITVAVNPASLTGSSYSGTITMSASSSVTQVPVTLTIGGNALISDLTSITINEPQGYGVSAPTAVRITSALPLSVSALVTSDLNWLSVDPPTGTTPATFNLRANVGNLSSGLMQGNYTGSLTVQASPSNYIQIPVALVVGAPASLQISPATLSFTYQIGDPLPGTVSVNISSRTASSQSVTATATTSDGGTWLKTMLAPATTPATLMVSVSPGTLAPGSYSGVINITPGGANASPQPVTVKLTVKPAPAPVIQSVNSAASYAAGTVAPGELVTIFGSRVGPAALAVPPAGTAPLGFADTAVTFDGIPAPILFASSTQTGVQVPYGILSGTTQVKVTYLGVSSAVTNLKSAATHPGLFTANSSGQGPLAAFNADGSQNTAGNPAARGSILVLYGTGEGKTNPISTEGIKTVIVEPLPRPVAPVTVNIGGQQLTQDQILYSGEVPGIISGVLQLNVAIPMSVQPGATIPVVVTVGGQATQSNITVAVK